MFNPKRLHPNKAGIAARPLIRLDTHRRHLCQRLHRYTVRTRVLDSGRF
jgi:hypothetical protein